MNKFRFTIHVLAIAIFMFAFASFAQAQATRTWVSGVGDDANPCSRTAPCKTFAGAISKTAPSGEINVLDDGGFGGVTITKAITIDGGGHIAGVLVSGTNAIVINALNTDTVTLRNLDINGLNTGLVGVKIIGVSGKVSVENCVIYGFGGGSARGISDERSGAGSGSLFVTNTVIRKSGQSAAVLIPSGGFTITASFESCRFQNNGSAGIVVEANVKATANNCSATGNTGSGFFAEGNNTAILNIQTCISSHNGQGITSNTNAEVKV